MGGCSQQQFQGGGQQIAGGSQVAGGQQVLGGGQQILGGGQSAGGQQVVGGQQVLGGQSAGGQQILGGQQSAGGQQVLGGQQSAATNIQAQDGVVPNTTHLHRPVVQSNEHSHDVAPQQRVYVPLPDSMKEPAVFMYKEPKDVSGPVYYDDELESTYTNRAASTVQQPKPAVMPRQKPVVHKGIGMPPAQPGQCFAKVNTPAKFKNIVKRVQVSPAVNKRVKVRGPQYTWVTKKVIARPATTRHQYIPAVYRNVTKKVLVKPAHYAWQKGKTGPVTRIDNMTGEILCRVKIPAVYRTVTQKVVARPAQRLKRHVPAVYRTIKQKKLASPAVYKTIKTPARFVNKTYRQQISGPRQEWKPIVCKAPTAQNSGVQRPQPAARKQVSANQRQLANEYNRQQQELHQLWLKQEAARKNGTFTLDRGHTQQHAANNNAQIRANQQRRAQHALKEKQRLAMLAQKRKQAQQARLRQVQIAKQKRMAQHQANLQAQRKAAQMRKLSQPKPTYTRPKAVPSVVQMAPKVRPYQQQRIATKPAPKVRQVVHTPKQRMQPKPQPMPKATAGAGDDNTPLTRANAVFRIQKALKQRGFNPGPVDGKLGPATVKALTAFQETKGLKTGTLNRDTLRALNLVK